MPTDNGRWVRTPNEQKANGNATTKTGWRWYWLPLCLAVGIGVGIYVQDFVHHSRGIAQQSEASSQVKQMLMKQQEAWNQGDLQRFLSEYEMSKDITFFSDKEMPPGWVALSDRFTNKYGSGKTPMGHLEFSELNFLTLRNDTVLVRGRWTTGPEHTGLFTILVRKTDAGWKIVHDHTSESKAKP